MAIVNCLAVYVNWFSSYLTNRLSSVRYSGALPSPFEVLSGVAQGSMLGSLLFNVFINDLCIVIRFSNYLLFADDIKILRALKCPQHYSLLKMDIDSIRNWRTANQMKLIISKTRVI
jgi:hypothetical protein